VLNDYLGSYISSGDPQLSGLQCTVHGAHTPQDRACIDMLAKGLAGNAALACEFAGVTV